MLFLFSNSKYFYKKNRCSLILDMNSSAHITSSKHIYEDLRACSSTTFHLLASFRKIFFKYFLCSHSQPYSICEYLLSCSLSLFFILKYNIGKVLINIILIWFASRKYSYCSYLPSYLISYKLFSITQLF